MRFAVRAALLAVFALSVRAEEPASLARAKPLETAAPWGPAWHLRVGAAIDDDPKWDWIAVSGKGDRVALATRGGVVRLINLENGERVFSIPTDGAAITSLAISRDGDELAWGTKTGMVTRCDAQGQNLRTFPAGNSRVRGLAYAPDGTLFSNRNSWLAAWEKNGDVRWSEYAGVDAAKVFALSPDGKFLVTAAKDGTLILRSAADALEEPGIRMEGLSNEIASLSFSNDGRYLAAATHKGEVAAWHVNLRERRLYAPPDPDGTPASIAWVPGRPAVLVARRGTHRVYDLESGTAHDLRPGFRGRTLARIVGTSSTTAQFAADHDLRPVAVEARPGSEVPGESPKIVGLAFSPDSRLLASVDSEGNLRVLNVRNGESKFALESLPVDTPVVAFSRSMDRVTTTRASGPEYDWDMPRLKRVVPPFENHPIRATQSLDGLRVASGRDTLYGQHFAIFDIMSRRPLVEFQGLEGAVVDMSLDRAGRRLAATDENCIGVWNAVTGELEDALPLEDDLFRPRRMQWLPDASAVLLEQSTEPRSWRAFVPRALVPLASLTSDPRGAAIAWSPDGRIFASSGEPLALHETSTGARISILPGGVNGATCAAFSPDGTLLAANAGESGLTLWTLRETREPGPITLPGLASRWLELDDADASVGWEAVEALSDSPEVAEALGKLALDDPDLRDSLPELRAKLLEAALQDLESDLLPRNERGRANLATFDDRLEVALFEEQPRRSARVSDLIQRQLLGLRAAPVSWPPIARGLRANAVLERIGTPVARGWLTNIAEKSPSPRLRADAAGALKRLDPRR